MPIVGAHLHRSEVHQSSTRNLRFHLFGLPYESFLPLHCTSAFFVIWKIFLPFSEVQKKQLPVLTLARGLLVELPVTSQYEYAELPPAELASLALSELALMEYLSFQALFCDVAPPGRGIPRQQVLVLVVSRAQAVLSSLTDVFRLGLHKRVAYFLSGTI